MRELRLLVVAGALAGCEGEALPSPAEVRALRILALTTTTPEVRPGQGARVGVVVLDPVMPRSVVVRWRLCDEAVVVDPRECPTAREGIELGEGLAVDLPPLATGRREGAYVVLAAACADGPPSIDPTSGHYRCGAGAPAEEAFRRIAARANGDLNQPPGISRWELQRGEVIARASETGELTLPRCDTAPCGPWTVRVVPVDGASEGASESLVASFYVTQGTMDRPRDGAAPGELRPLTARWTPGTGGGTPQLGVVLRDQRGGESARLGRVSWR